ncbi:MAG TPA: hypothetical protein VFU22_01370, partial [Roseiflexaceae bacterium]|nr:hypothetical protein [Roseiflexaceae bacterium]
MLVGTLVATGTGVFCVPDTDVSTGGTGVSVGPAVGGIAVPGSGVAVSAGTGVAPIGVLIGAPIAAVGDNWIDWIVLV